VTTQKGWKAALPRIQFAIMNTINTSTGCTPFQLKTGCSPHLIPPLVPATDTDTPEQISARTIISKLELNVQDAQDNLLAAKVQQAYHANIHRGPEDVYKIGDLVMLPTKNRRREYKCAGTKHVAQFMPRNDGPYKVVCTFPEHSEYTLKLSQNPQLFPGFHAHLLKRHIPNSPTLFPIREPSRPKPIVTPEGI
jgi:hypothetical protein